MIVCTIRADPLIFMDDEHCFPKTRDGESNQFRSIFFQSYVAILAMEELDGVSTFHAEAFMHGDLALIFFSRMRVVR